MRLIDAEFEEAHYTSMLLNPTSDVTDNDKKNARIIIDALRMAKTVEIPTIEPSGDLISRADAISVLMETIAPPSVMLDTLVMRINALPSAEPRGRGMKSICENCKHKYLCDETARLYGLPNMRVTECKEFEPIESEVEE